jgi:hypothetical protein
MIVIEIMQFCRNRWSLMPMFTSPTIRNSDGMKKFNPIQHNDLKNLKFIFC